MIIDDLRCPPLSYTTPVRMCRRKPRAELSRAENSTGPWCKQRVMSAENVEFIFPFNLAPTLLRVQYKTGSIACRAWTWWPRTDIQTSRRSTKLSQWVACSETPARRAVEMSQVISSSFAFLDGANFYVFAVLLPVSSSARKSFLTFKLATS